MESRLDDAISWCAVYEQVNFSPNSNLDSFYFSAIHAICALCESFKYCTQVFYSRTYFVLVVCMLFQ